MPFGGRLPTYIYKKGVIQHLSVLEESQTKITAQQSQTYERVWLRIYCGGQELGEVHNK